MRDREDSSLQMAGGSRSLLLRERERERQTDRQTDRETERERERERERP